VLPAHERFHAGDLSRVYVDLRLVVNPVLLAFQSPAQLVFEREPLQCSLVHVSRVELVIAAARLLGAIERCPGAL
jgi:hypothetical protein